MSINDTDLIINNLRCNEHRISINVRFSYENRDLQNGCLILLFISLPWLTAHRP